MLLKAISKIYSSFLSLLDTPSSYSGQGGKYVKVNTGETGLEFNPSVSDALMQFSVIHNPALTNPVIPVGTGGTWDDHIREIGNILYDPTDIGKEYKVLYSGYTSSYSNPKYMGYAYSSDGKTWVKYGQVSTFFVEDPYLIKVGSTYWVYYEGLADNSAIHRASSADCINWTQDTANNPILNSGGPGTWDEYGAASPVVWVDGSTMYMIYEGADGSYAPSRPYGDGKMGLASSADGGITWSRDINNPIFAGEDSNWVDNAAAGAVVPDDIVKINGLYWMTWHGEANNASGIWKSGIAYSEDLINWIDDFRSPFTTDGLGDVIHTASLFKIGTNWATLYYSGDVSGIYFGWLKPLSTFIDLTDSPSSYSGQAGKIVKVKSTEDGLEFTTASTSLTVKEIDGSPSYTSITILQVPNASLTQPSAGIARLNLDLASFGIDGGAYSDTYISTANVDAGAY